MSVHKESAGPSQKRFNSICVFGSPNLGRDAEFRKAAYSLAAALAARKIHLVYGGGIQGLRGCMVGSAVLRGTKVLAVTLKDSSDKNTTGFVLGTELKVSTINERMAHMFLNGEAFIAIPGGLETLEEISIITSWANSNYHQKPLGLLNVNGFYDGLLSFLNHAVEQGFISQAMRRIIVSSSDAGHLLDQLHRLVFENPSLGKQLV